MSDESTHTDSTSQIAPHRWRALALLASMQFLLVVDLTVVNIALPRIGSDLDLDPSGLVWVVDAYALTAGGLLLLGGRIADLVGRRRIFLIGVTVFAAGSLLAGVAPAAGWLVAGRVLQGVGDALAAPAALALIVVLFPDGSERAKAIGVWGALAGIGGVTGTVISGVLTQFASWRLVFLIALPVAVTVLALLPRVVVGESRMRSAVPPRFTGVAAGTVGLASIVFGLVQASTEDWSSPSVFLPLIAGAVLVGVMVLIERRSPAPVIPLRFFTDRVRLTANAVTLVNAGAFVSYLFVLSLYVQRTLDYSALQAGLAYIPIGLAIGAGLVAANAALPRIGLRTTFALGCAVTAIGLVVTVLSLGADAAYVRDVLPSMVIVGLGQGILLPTMTNAALVRVDGQDAGLASGVQVTMSHLGGALGLAVLITAAARRSNAEITDGAAADGALLAGYATALSIAAVAMLTASVAVLLLAGPGKRRVAAT
ncbi:MFS transporter [Microbacterium sp. zg.B48]|uniref:MFS transporter n=1 Tax=Microbacterium sp. zg.B48 TaxID=2969408 RepID=UPI00214D135A|nr:MFS transporter [Microbacterium sp. zg.B48]MCR2762498.1 MFS transporter [Microbacterium sp. zg.B48]